MASCDFTQGTASAWLNTSTEEMAYSCRTSSSAFSNRSFMSLGSQSLAHRLCGTENSYLEKKRCKSVLCLLGPRHLVFTMEPDHRCPVDIKKAYHSFEKRTSSLKGSM